MIELGLLLVLLVGGVIGWLIRSWFNRRELAHERREQQRRQLNMKTTLSRTHGEHSDKDTEHDATVAISNDDLYATGVNHDQSAQVMALESKLAQAECDYNDLTQSFSLKDSEIDELYQIASHVLSLIHI